MESGSKKSARIHASLVIHICDTARKMLVLMNVGSRTGGLQSVLGEIILTHS
jgi:hypothetical protein